MLQPREFIDSSIKIELPDMIATTARLAQVMAEEVDYLEQMKIKDLTRLQPEKEKLARRLAMMTEILKRNPKAKEGFLREDVDTMEQVAGVFEKVMQENYRKLMVAKEVNGVVVKAIADVIRDHTRKVGYGRSGMMNGATEIQPSVTLNEHI